MAKILVVDDEPIIAMTVADWLDDLGHVAVGPAVDLASALALAEQDIDGAILDIALGAQTTLEVARRLRARAIAYIVSSGHDVRAMDPLFADGDTLPKPFGFEAFKQAVERMLRPRS